MIVPTFIDIENEKVNKKKEKVEEIRAKTNHLLTYTVFVGISNGG